MRRATIHAVRPEDRSTPSVGEPGMILGGKYRLEEAIARGGMARVWRATHVTLNRPVAVKFVESWGLGEDRIERFLREAKVAASVRHGHVVDILDFGATREGEPYMVMELLEGETLDQRMIRGAIDNDELVDIASQLLSGLDAVHRAGIVHRDLKPGNVFLTIDEVDGLFTRLLDFGISQDVDEAASEERVVIGTPEYMSPEQAFGDALDARSDIYSVGVVLYEMLSGVLPFEHSDPQQVVELVAHATPMSIRELRPDVPKMCAVVERAMAKEPSARFDSARDMRRALLDAADRPDPIRSNSTAPRDSHVSGMQARAATYGAAEGLSPSDPPPLPTSRGRVWLMVGGLLIAAAGAGAVAWWGFSGTGLGLGYGAPRAVPLGAPTDHEAQDGVVETSETFGQPTGIIDGSTTLPGSASGTGERGVEAEPPEEPDTVEPTEQATETPTRRRRRARVRRRVDPPPAADEEPTRPEPESPESPSIVRELDF